MTEDLRVGKNKRLCEEADQRPIIKVRSKKLYLHFTILKYHLMKNFYTLAACVIVAFTSMAQSPRTVLLETRETTQLQAVADGICEKESVKALYGNNMAVISFHDDDVFGGGDPLYSQAAGDWSTFFAPPNYPSGLVDRVSFNGMNLNLGLSLWADTIASRINQTTDGLVTMPEVLYDAAENEAFVRVQVNFTEDIIDNRDLRFFLYLVQDGLVADQLVDTLGGSPCSLFSDTIDTAFNFVHNDVVIASPSNFDGVENIIANQTSSGMQFTTSFAFDLPNGVSIDDVRVVGFVSNYTPSEVTQNQVVNAAKSSTFTLYDSQDLTDDNHPENVDNPNSEFFPGNWPTAVGTIKGESIPAVAYPNPITDLGIVEFHLPEAQMIDVSLYDVMGKRVATIYTQQLASGRQLAALNAFNYAPGTYFVRIEGDGFLEQLPVVIAR